MANSAADLDSIDVAVRVIDSAIAKFGPRDEFLMNKGLYLSAKRDSAGAEKIFRGLAEADTSQAAYQLNLAHSLAMQNDRKKKEEAYELYRQLRNTFSSQFQLDSLITDLGHQLGKN